MEDRNKKILFMGLSLLIAGCGVKGKPNPPRNPPPLGRGEPMYKETKKKNTSSTTGATYSVDEGSEQ